MIGCAAVDAESLDLFERFLREAGHHVFRTPNGRWYTDTFGSLINLPPGAPIDPDPDELLKLVLQSGHPLVRYCTSKVAPTSARVVCDATQFGMASLTGKARNQTRRGLERNAVSRIGWDELAREGMLLNQQTWQRQGRRARFGLRYWLRLCAAAAHTPTANAWGATANGALGAFAITIDVCGVRHILLHMSRTASLPTYPNNAIVYALMLDARERGIGQVSYGLKSSARTSGLDHFKVSMGFFDEPVGVRIYVPPPARALMRVLGRPWGRRLLDGISHDLPEKLDTVLRLI